ncbi:hypothetical protein BGX28_000462 [Mortierella sp. GBA30]|nr:hypothetical protein BGX28_000462 [Mortierella sp. GBA30]
METITNTRKSLRLVARAEQATKPSLASTHTSLACISDILTKSNTPSSKRTWEARRKQTGQSVNKTKRITKAESTRKRPPEDNGDDHHDTGAARPAKLRRRRNKAELVVSLENHTMDIDNRAACPPSLIKKTRSINPSDPCEQLPTEIWHQVLSFLPLSQAARSSLVSIAWLDGARSWSTWRQICEKLKLRSPKRKVKSQMAIVCLHSCYICDSCHGYSTGLNKFIASQIPLPVDIVVRASRDIETVDSIQSQPQQAGGQVNLVRASPSVVERWNLCCQCRQAYYQTHPERYRFLPDEAKELQNPSMKISTRVASSRQQYGLSNADFRGLQYKERRSSYRRFWWSAVKWYDLRQVQAVALRKHGGWIGVDAFKSEIAKTRKDRFKERQALFQMQTAFQ